MPNTKFLGKRPKNTIARLIQLRKDADKAGDTDTRDKLAAIIEEQGGTVPNGDIPKDETKMSRLERLRIEAIDCGDTDSAAKLLSLIQEEQCDVTEPEPHAPHEGRNLVDKLAPVESASCIDHANTEGASGRVWIQPDAENTSEPPITPPESDEERLEGPEATQKINDGTASVNAAARIKKEGWRLDEIPARFGGKVDMNDIKNYKKLLTVA